MVLEEPFVTEDDGVSGKGENRVVTQTGDYDIRAEAGADRVVADRGVISLQR